MASWLDNALGPPTVTQNGGDDLARRAKTNYQDPLLASDDEGNDRTNITVDLGTLSTLDQNILAAQVFS